MESRVVISGCGSSYGQKCPAYPDRREHEVIKNMINGGPLVLKKRMSALIADSSSLYRVVLESMLRFYGIETQSVTGCRAALDLLLAGTHFNLIFLDLNLPPASGPPTASVIRSMGVGGRLVGMGDAEFQSGRRQFQDVGVHDYMVKPLDPCRLVSILRQVDAYGF